MMNNVIYLLTIILIPIFHNALKAQDYFTWPNGAKAAVSLTYDDGIDTQLDIAIPDLNRAGLTGTFYLQGDNLTPERIDQWRSAANNGHELGNHSIFHPCLSSHDFVWEEFASEDYTIRRMIKELSVMNNILYSLDGKEGPRTYAYTCSETEVGKESIIDSLKASGLFVGARGGGSGVVSDFKQLNIFNVPSMTTVEGTANDMIPFIKQAGDEGGLAVFMFHGVGGDYLNISREDHQEVLDYLNKNKGTYWTATFSQIIGHIKRERQRLGWE